MLLTVTTTHRPATDLGYLLVKHPDRVHTVRAAHRHGVRLFPGGDAAAVHGRAAARDRPGRLSGRTVRVAGQRPGRRSRCGRYVNDRPVRRVEPARRRAEPGASAARCAATSKDRPELAARPIPLEIRVPALRCRGGADLAARCSARSAGRSTATPIPLDDDASRVGRQPVRRPDADRHGAARRRAQPPLRAAAGARRRQALLGGPRRGGQAAAGRRGLAGRAPGAGADRPALPGAPARRWPPTRSAGSRAPGADARRGRRRRTTSRTGRADRGGRGRRQPAADRAAGRGSAARPCWPRWPRPARPGCSTSAAAPGRCSPTWSRTARYTEIVGVDVSTAALDMAAPPAAAGPAARAAARPDHAAAVRADLPRRPAARLRRGGADGGHRARRPAAAARPGGARVRPRPPGDRHRDHAQRRVQRALRGPATGAAPPRPPLRVDPGRSSPRWARRRRGRLRLHASSCAASATRTPTSARRPSWRCSPGRRRRDHSGHSRAVRWSCWSASPARASRPSPGGTSRPPRCCPPTRSAALVADDENDQSASADAFDALHYVAGKRLRAGRLTVVDATNVQPHARAGLVTVAREHDVLPVAIVLDVPEACAGSAPQARPDRDFGRQVARPAAPRPAPLARVSWPGRASARSTCCAAPDEIDAAAIAYEKLFNDRRDLTGPFDIIGDVHGCRAELETLLDRLGWRWSATTPDRPVDASHPDGRTAVFVGDLVDRGPDSPGVLRLVMGMVAAGTALCVPGNHEEKLLRKLRGRNVRRHPRAGRDAGPARRRADAGFVAAVPAFIDGADQPLRARRRAAGRRARRAQGGLPRPGVRPGARVRPVRRHHRRDRRVRPAGALPVGRATTAGAATVVYGHTPTPAAEWVNNTICLDTGCVFGGALTALRYPARGAGVGAGRPRSTTSRSARWSRRRRPARPGRC